MKTIHFFYSWQSDTLAACGRSLIEGALKEAIASIANDGEYRIILDQDARGDAGSDDLHKAIFSKIEAATGFIADVTIINSDAPDDRQTANPNVLYEAGYAHRALTAKRCILVQNTFFGTPEKLPFDIRQRGITVFASDPASAERAPVRRELARKLEMGIRGILATHVDPLPEVTLTLERKPVRGGQDNHLYAADVRIVNNSKKRIDDWQLDLKVPRLLHDSVTYGCEIPSDDPRYSHFRIVGPRLVEAQRSLGPGEKRGFAINYVMNNRIYYEHRDVFEMPIIATALINGELVAEVRKTVHEMTNF